MKRKVGEKVIIREDLIKDEMYGIACFVSGMVKYLGKETEIIEVRGNTYLLEIDSHDFWLWTDEMFEEDTKHEEKAVEVNTHDKLISILEDNSLLPILSTFISMDKKQREYSLEMLKSGKVEEGYFTLLDVEKMNYVLLKLLNEKDHLYFLGLQDKYGEEEIIGLARKLEHWKVTAYSTGQQLGLMCHQVEALIDDRYYGIPDKIYQGLNKFCVFEENYNLGIDMFLQVHKATTSKDNRMLHEFEGLL